MDCTSYGPYNIWNMGIKYMDSGIQGGASGGWSPPCTSRRCRYTGRILICHIYIYMKSLTAHMFLYFVCLFLYICFFLWFSSFVLSCSSIF